MKFKDLKEVCFSEMLVFDATDGEVMYNEPELVIEDYENERYANWVVLDITTCNDIIYVAIKEEN